MVMNKPAFTTNPARVARLQANYDAGVDRERIPPVLRERLDTECLVVPNEKLKFLFQNAMEGYSKDLKNAKVVEYNNAHATATEKKSRSYMRFA